ncbi:MAG: nitrilase family protein [Flavobacteriales bacterium]|nr:nitrilase family protein [Flavobacteriales bacterium]MCX7768815.1 nitrilase family protein [Flavobacteriales bacterium]MDW8410411.1 nitrilase-related carbon-nitrogen hydrolase [Flavobacteriales bacterium]
MQDLNVVLIQTAPVWENVVANLHLPPDAKGVIQPDSIVVLPELFSTGYTMNTTLAEDHPGAACLWLLETAAVTGAVMCGSVMVRHQGRCYNRFYWAEPSGRLMWYDKKHLFTLAGEEKYFSAGQTQVLVEWRGWRIALFVCYDLRFPVWCRRRPDFDYHLALFVASWPDRRSYAWRTLLKARAIENQSFVVGVNRCGRDGNGVLHAGDSMAIDYAGHPIMQLTPFTPCVGVARLCGQDLLRFREALPFQKDADPFSFN